MGGPGSIQMGLNAAHGFEIVHRSLFAAGKNDAPAAVIACLTVIHVCKLHIEEGSHTSVLAEAAAGLFIASGGVANASHGIHADKSSGASLTPQSRGLQTGANCAGLTAVRVNHNLRVDACASKSST